MQFDWMSSRFPRLKLAGLPAVKTLDQFDLKFQPSMASQRHAAHVPYCLWRTTLSVAADDSRSATPMTTLGVASASPCSARRASCTSSGGMIRSNIWCRSRSAVLPRIDVTFGQSPKAKQSVRNSAYGRHWRFENITIRRTKTDELDLGTRRRRRLRRTRL
jgi:hypothetical protein